MVKKLIVMLGTLLAVGAFAQEAPKLGVSKQGVPKLGILPFTGGQGRDGDTIATLFANSRDLGQEFAIVPRTSSVAAIMQEQQFQRTSGLTDTDTIARLGKLANADYVVSGHVARLGNANLLLISIVNVVTMEQIAGDHRIYDAIEEVSGLLPEMAARIIESVRRRTYAQEAARPALAIPSLDIQDERVARDDAELLARILATEIANTHKYTVLPRTSTIETVIQEQGVQKSGLTERTTLAAIGKALNAQYVLSGTITNLGRQNLFTAQILDIETATLQPGAGSSRQYRNLEDGVNLMRELAQEISGVADEEKAAAREQEQREARMAAERERQEAAAARERAEEEAAVQKWKNSLIYGGLRLGVSPRFYGLSKDISAGQAENGASFEAALQVSAYLFSLFDIEVGLQTELSFGMDTVSYSGTDNIGGFTASFASSSLLIPLLAKSSYRMPNGFVVSMFTGPYFPISLGKIKYTSSGGTNSYNFKITAGWLIGIATGIRLGPGTLFADIRYGGDFGNTSISDNNGVLSVYSRNMVSFTLGYELGFIRR
jgi:TolB-like protein